ncbi:MAG: GntR family transcriptional regulator [Planctomycetota bacterium]
MAIDIQVTTGSAIPIYRQIVDQVRAAIRHARLAPGDLLPSVRALAERLVLNPNTVAKAFAELTREGVVASVHGRGVFVAEPRQILTRSERTRRLQHALDAFLSAVAPLQLEAEQLMDALRIRLRTDARSTRRA